MSAPGVMVNRNKTRSGLEGRIVKLIAGNYRGGQWNESHRAGALYGQAMRMSPTPCLTMVDSHSGGHDCRPPWLLIQRRSLGDLIQKMPSSTCTFLHRVCTCVRVVEEC